jgi:hypothetical protein
VSTHIPTLAQIEAAYIRTRPDATKAVTEFQAWLHARDGRAVAEALTWAANFGLVIQSDEQGDESARSLQQRSRERLLAEAANALNGSAALTPEAGS